MSENIISIQEFFIQRTGLSSLFDVGKISSCGKILSMLKKLSPSESETLKIVLNTDQFESVLKSLEEMRQKKVVSFNDAFSDLQ
jgi:hypothetical protein